jgi:hypothetical protein
MGDLREVVAIEGDVNAADGRLDALMLRDGCGQALGDGHTAALNADQDQTLSAAMFFDDLVRNAYQRASDVVGGHDLAARHETEF